MATCISNKPKVCSFTITITIMALALLLVVVHSQVSDVTYFTYDAFIPKPKDLTYQGGAHNGVRIPSGPTFLRLTELDSSGAPVSWSSSRVLHSRPVRFWETYLKAEFDTTIKFVITPSKSGAADGLTFFIAPVNPKFDQSSSGGNLGIFDGSANGNSPYFFAVEFDTYVNYEWDPNYRHIGIDIQSRVSKATARFDSATGEVVTARIRYHAHDNMISVVATTATQTASLSYVCDLGTILTQQVQVGLSSSTGASVSELGVHDIIYWDFVSDLAYVGTDNNNHTYIRQYV